MLEVLSVTVVQGTGPDVILMTVNLPNGCWPYNGHQSVKMDVAAGSGPEYVEKHLGIKPDKVVKG